jgi:peptide methionine sulfoxide reductase MsrB
MRRIELLCSHCQGHSGSCVFRRPSATWVALLHQ